MGASAAHRTPYGSVGQSVHPVDNVSRFSPGLESVAQRSGTEIIAEATAASVEDGRRRRRMPLLFKKTSFVCLDMMPCTLHSAQRIGLFNGCIAGCLPRTLILLLLRRKMAGLARVEAEK